MQRRPRTRQPTHRPVTVTQTASVTFTAGGVSAAQSTLTASPGSVTADGSRARCSPPRSRCAGQPGRGQDRDPREVRRVVVDRTVNGVTDHPAPHVHGYRRGHRDHDLHGDRHDRLADGQPDGSGHLHRRRRQRRAVDRRGHSGLGDGRRTSSATVTVTARDAFDNPVAAQIVTLGQGPGSSTIAPVSGTTNGSGVATFTVHDTPAETVIYSASVGATPILQTAQVVFTPGPATQLAFGQQPTDTPSRARRSPRPSRSGCSTRTTTSPRAPRPCRLAIKSRHRRARRHARRHHEPQRRRRCRHVQRPLDREGRHRLPADGAVGRARAADSVDVRRDRRRPCRRPPTISAVAERRSPPTAPPTSTITVHARDANDNAPHGRRRDRRALDDARHARLGQRQRRRHVLRDAHRRPTSGSAQRDRHDRRLGDRQPRDRHVAAAADERRRRHRLAAGTDPVDRRSRSRSTATTRTRPSSARSTVRRSLPARARRPAAVSPTAHHTLRIHAVNGNGDEPGHDAITGRSTRRRRPSRSPPPPARTRRTPRSRSSRPPPTRPPPVGSVTFRYAANAAACTTGTLISTDTSAPYSATWTTPADGSYVVCAIATDAVGKTAQANASVIVDQTAPGGTFPAVGTAVGPDRYVRGSVALHATAPTRPASSARSSSSQARPRSRRLGARAVRRHLEHDAATARPRSPRRSPTAPATRRRSRSP